MGYEIVEGDRKEDEENEENEGNNDTETFVCIACGVTLVDLPGREFCDACDGEADNNADDDEPKPKP